MSLRYACWLVAFVVVALAARCGPNFPVAGTDNGLVGHDQDRRTARDDFENVFTRWKGMLGQLRNIELAYHTTGQRQQAGLAEQFESKLAEGKILEVELIETATRAFATDPEANQDLERFLTWMASLLVGQQHYEDALRITQLLIENQIENPVVYQSAAKAAFACNEFDMAEEYYRILVEQRGEIPPNTTRLRSMAYCKKQWERERRLRDSEQLADDLPRVLLCTNRGEIELELFENEAPNTVANFIHLVEQKFYDGLAFHTVIPEFAAQCGCPEATGEGGPGYAIRCECYGPDRRVHFRGSLSMAHHGRDTGGSQFHLMFQPARRLDGTHTVFGRIVRGLEVLAKLQPRGQNPFSRSNQPDRILEARVLRKRNHPYTPTTIRDRWHDQRETQQERMDRYF